MCFQKSLRPSEKNEKVECITEKSIFVSKTVDGPTWEDCEVKCQESKDYRWLMFLKVNDKYLWKMR